MSELKKNLPQSMTLWPAICILFTGGLNMAWGLGFYSGLVISNHLRYCWFIGGILGAIAAAFVVKKFTVKWLLIFPSVLVTIGGVIYMCGTQSEATLTAARYLNGFAFGWTFVVCILVGGEQVVKSLRGRYLSMEAIAINVGIFGEIVFAYNDLDKGPTAHASVTIIFGVIAAVLALICPIDSPFYFLERNDENQALSCLQSLQTPHIVTQETQEIFAEHKHFIAEQKIKSRSEVLREGLIAMSKVALHRCFVAMSFTLPLNAALIFATIVGPNVMWPLAFYSLMRLVGSIVFCCFTQKIGRKKPILVSLPICAGMLIGVGCIFNTDGNATNTIALLIVYQFFAGLYMGPSGSQISEAFPLQLKPFFIAGVVIIEMLLQIIILNIDRIDIEVYCFTFANLTLAYAVFVYFFIPETSQTTLREAQAKFRQCLCPGFK